VLLELALGTQRRTLPTRVHTSVRPATTRRFPTTEHDAASAGAVANSPAPSARAMTSAADRRTCAIRGIQRNCWPLRDMESACFYEAFRDIYDLRFRKPSVYFPSGTP
jgi:hypothetical protein